MGRHAADLCGYSSRRTIAAIIQNLSSILPWLKGVRTLKPSPVPVHVVSVIMPAGSVA
jgi:hypothetical protein